jgi:hypothetical protein
MKKLLSKFHIYIDYSRKWKYLKIQHDWKGIVLEHRFLWSKGFKYDKYYLPF